MSNLAESRKLFVQVSRRFDLVLNGDLETNVDNGANYFINQGQKYLDDRVQTRRQLRRFNAVTANGDFTLTIPGLASVEAIWVIDAVNGRSDNLLRSWMSNSDFLRTYSGLVADWNSGIPSNWAFNVDALAPSHDGALVTSAEEDGDVQLGKRVNKDGIIFYPKADGAYTFDIRGRFKEVKLLRDDDESYWTVMEPELLAMAAAFVFENRMGSQQRKQDHLIAMEPFIDELDNQEIEFEMVQGTRAGGR